MLVWLSFVRDGKFAGVIVTEAEGDEVDARTMAVVLRKTWRLGINPGGEVSAEKIPDDGPGARVPRDRLLSKEELRVFKAGLPKGQG